MSDMQTFWGLWSPFWHYMEDNFLDLDSINRLASTMNNPVLVVGAGQGLLVEELQKKGLKVDGIDAEPQMIAFAKKRRNLELILANGNNMPFADNTYKTSIIATGVVDFMDDEKQIHSILSETMRITDDAGKVLVAFNKIGTAEPLMRLLGLLTEDGRWYFKRMYQMIRLGPIAFLKAIKREAKVGYFSAFAKLMRLQFLSTKKEKETMKKISNIWKEASDPDKLIECIPDSIPYRNEKMIKGLFERLNVPIREVFPFDSCTIVQV